MEYLPHSFLVLDHEGKDVLCLARGSREVEAGEDALAVGQRLAWLVKAGLYDGVVLGKEVEFDQIAGLGDDVLGLEVQAVVGGGRACPDAVDDTGRSNLESRCGSTETEKCGCCESDVCEADHVA